MTDLEKVQSLLDELGIIHRGNEDWEEDDESIRLRITAHDGPKQVGYSDFVAIFTFDLDGLFKDIGIWE